MYLFTTSVLFCEVAVSFFFFNHFKITADVSFFGLLVTVVAWRRKGFNLTDFHNCAKPKRIFDSHFHFKAKSAIWRW